MLAHFALMAFVSVVLFEALVWSNYAISGISISLPAHIFGLALVLVMNWLYVVGSGKGRS